LQLGDRLREVGVLEPRDLGAQPELPVREPRLHHLHAPHSGAELGALLQHLVQARGDLVGIEADRLLVVALQVVAQRDQRGEELREKVAAHDVGRDALALPDLVADPPGVALVGDGGGVLREVRHEGLRGALVARKDEATALPRVADGDRLVEKLRDLQPDHLPVAGAERAVGALHGQLLRAQQHAAEGDQRVLGGPELVAGHDDRALELLRQLEAGARRHHLARAEGIVRGTADAQAAAHGFLRLRQAALAGRDLRKHAGADHAGADAHG
jgi:hypothetical protein